MSYYRPSGFGASNNNDPLIGILIVILSGIGVCLSAAGGILTGGFFAAFKQSMNDAGGRSEVPGFLGGFLTLFFGLIALGSLITLIGGIGICGSKKWGFQIVLISSLISAILGLLSFPSGLIALIFHSLFLWYSFSRLNGKMGDPPV